MQMMFFDGTAIGKNDRKIGAHKMLSAVEALVHFTIICYPLSGTAAANCNGLLVV